MKTCLMRLSIVLVLLLIAGSAHATTVDRYATGNTIVMSNETTPKVVTFNTVIRNLTIINPNAAGDIHVSLSDVGGDWWALQNSLYVTPTSITASTVAVLIVRPTTTISIKLATEEIGFYVTGVAMNVDYLATTDVAPLTNQP